MKTPENPSNRIAATWFSDYPFTINVNIIDGNAHQVALYALDWDSSARSETINVLDAVTGAVLNSRVLPAGSFHTGEYLAWTVTGSVEFQIVRDAGANAVISGFFFDTPNSTTGANPPVDTALPVITGTAQVGKVLASSTGTWTGATSFAYQWAGNGTPIAGATASTYTPVSTDVGHTLRATVTATGSGGTASATSAATAAVAAATAVAPVNSQLPVISGTAQVGKVQTSSTGTWTGATSFAYQWAGNGASITGATAATYTPVSTDVGHTLTATVTATGSGGGTASATSAPTVPIVAGSGGGGGAAAAANWYTNGYPVPQYTCNSNYYVSASGSDSNSGTLASPWLTIAHAWSTVAGPGVCINVVGPGNYPQSSTLSLSKGGNLNSATGWAVLRAVNASGSYNPAVDSLQNIHAGTAPRIYVNSTSYTTPLALNHAYIIVDGFEVDGNAAMTQGVCIDAEGSNTHHHLIAENNLVHDCGGAGFQWNNTEYLWIYNNAIHDNARTNGAEMSGISVWEPATAASFTVTSWDTALPFHILTLNNILWHNYENSSISAAQHTDGDGIIYDTFTNQGTPYTYPSLIYGNVACFNGGGAIQLDSANNVTIANNSTYSNYLDLENGGTYRGECNNWQSSSNNTWINNICMNVTSGAGINSGSGKLSNNLGLSILSPASNASGNTFTSNISYPTAPYSNSTAQSGGTGSGHPSGQVVSNPLFTSPGTLPSASSNTPPCNLALQAGSPALGKGVAAPYIPKTAPFNLGAY